jgi:fatty-acyl-CoA synthase
MADVEPGEVGEIIARGPNLMQGYWREPEATAEAFEGGWFHSGDRVRQDDDGFGRVTGRKQDMIISGGENIYCAELEIPLFSHPEIADVAVYGRAHDKWGDVPVAAVVLTADSELDVETLDSWLDDTLVRFKHPEHLDVLDEVPRNASGKVTKGRLRENDPA